jgi:hypothetical protein
VVHGICYDSAEPVDSPAIAIMPMAGSSGTQSSSVTSKDLAFSPPDVAIHNADVFQETEIHSSYVLPAPDIAPRTSDLAPERRKDNVFSYPDWSKMLVALKEGKRGNKLTRREISSRTQAAINGTSVLDKDLSNANGPSAIIDSESTHPLRNPALVESCRSRIDTTLVATVPPNVLGILSDRPSPLQGQDDCVTSSPATLITSAETGLNRKVSLFLPNYV